MSHFHHRALSVLAALTALAAPAAHAQTFGTDFAANYSFLSLGSAPDLPTRYGGLTFLNSNTLLIGGNANTSSGALYTIGVTRDANQHITGFAGVATPYLGGGIGTYNDGGVVFGPGGVLFTSQWPVNKLGQTKPGSTVEDKVIDLDTLGIANSHSAINFVPTGFGGAGKVKLVSYGSGDWYSATLAPDGNGTFDLTAVQHVDVDAGTDGLQTLEGGPEGFSFIAANNPGFQANSLLLSEFQNGTVSAYQLDANGDPIASTRRVFLSGLSGAEGSTIDPVTGDFMFSTFGGANQVVVVQGFLTPAPEPAQWLLLLGGLAVCGGLASQRTRRPVNG